MNDRQPSPGDLLGSVAPTGDVDDLQTRWRLVLGRFSAPPDAPPLGELEGRMDRALDFLYGREYEGRRARASSPSGMGEGERAGSLDATRLMLPEWLREVRELFPRETVEIVERHALHRYRLNELVTDPEVLRHLEPSYELLRAVLTLKGLMRGPVVDVARSLVRRVVTDLARRMEGTVRRALSGARNRYRYSPLKVASNFDARRTVRSNLAHYDAENRRLQVRRLHFFSRVERHLPWHVILAVDQSGSMVDSVIHSAIMAGILATLPSLKVSLVLFDTSVVDVTGHLDDPTEALMAAQLGGGTDIARALAYCHGLVETPRRTVLIVVTDFCEGASEARLLHQVKAVLEAGVRLLGLAALDSRGEAGYDRDMAGRWVDAGAEVAALTPDRLADWLVGVVRP